MWLAEQCAAYETQIQNISRERGKDHFTEELYRKLKQVTRRWQSWNHRAFGAVTSRGSVDLVVILSLNYYAFDAFLAAVIFRTRSKIHF